MLVFNHPLHNTDTAKISHILSVTGRDKDVLMVVPKHQD